MIYQYLNQSNRNFNWSFFSSRMILLFAAFGIIVTGCSQSEESKYTYTVKSEMQSLTGTVVKLSGAADADSLCTQGVDYYALQDFSPSGEVKSSYILDFSAMDRSFDIGQYVGKTVQCQGEIVDRKWTVKEGSEVTNPANDSGSETFSCEVFRIKSI